MKTNTEEPVEHFKGKDALSHVIEARIRGKAITDEMHGAELPGHLFAFCDAAKETSVVLLFLTILLQGFSIPGKQIAAIMGIFALVFLVWKLGRSALLGWTRLERLHRLIEEERWEIQHHRAQERKELQALYQAKGFSGKLLEEVVDVLMGDDNRLLQVMLEEELGLTLGTFEHPLKQGVGAAIGVIIPACILGVCYLWLPIYALFASGILIIALASAFAAKKEKNKVINAIVWNLALSMLSASIAYFICKLITNLAP